MDCVGAIVSIKQINDLFNSKLPNFNSKQVKEVKSITLYSFKIIMLECFFKLRVRHSLYFHVQRQILVLFQLYFNGSKYIINHY